jgi:hypothetical protein
MHPILTHPDLLSTLLMPAKDEHASILTRPDSHTTLSMSAKDESVGEHASNSKTSGLTDYIVNASKR